MAKSIGHHMALANQAYFYDLKSFQDGVKSEELEKYLKSLPPKAGGILFQNFLDLANQCRDFGLKNCDHPQEHIHVPYRGREECKRCGAYRTAEEPEELSFFGQWSIWDFR